MKLTCLPQTHAHAHTALILLGLTWIAAHLAAEAAQGEPLPPEHMRPARPPRGYCTPIARIVNPGSRCYKHLSWLAGGKGNGEGGAAQAGSGPASEELVYVRLETTGARLNDLRTRPINELVAEGVLAHLLDPSPRTAAFPTGSGPVAEAGAGDQFWGHLANASRQEGRLDERCRLSVERLLCRLAYPSCHFRRSNASPLARPPCREDCLLVRDAICANLKWAQFAHRLAQAFNATLRSVLNELDLRVQSGQPIGPAAAATGAAPLPALSASATPPTSSSLASAAGSSSLSAPPSARTSAPNLGDAKLTAHGSQSNASSIHFYWPHEHSLDSCESLPPLRALFRSHHNKRLAAAATSGPRWPICSDAGLTRAHLEPQINQPVEQQQQQQASECLRSPQGLEYRGTRNYTLAGLACQHWASQEPHKHPNAELLFDNMRDARNHCRNPGGLELLPWCYTRNASVRWQYCSIEPCLGPT